MQVSEVPCEHNVDIMCSVCVFVGTLTFLYIQLGSEVYGDIFLSLL